MDTERTDEFEGAGLGQKTHLDSDGPCTLMPQLKDTDSSVMWTDKGEPWSFLAARLPHDA